MMTAHSDGSTLTMTNSTQDMFKRQGSSEIPGHQNTSNVINCYNLGTWIPAVFLAAPCIMIHNPTGIY